MLLVLHVVRLCGTPGCIATYVRVLLKVLQLSGICVHFQIGTECLVVRAFQVRYEYGFSVLQVGPLLCGEHMPVYFCRNNRCLAFAESVRCAGVLGPASIHVQFDEGGELLPLAVDHVFQEYGLSFAQGLLVFRSQLYVADLFRDIYFSVFRIVSCVLRSSGYFVQSDKRGEQAPSVRFMSSTRMVCPSLSILIWLGESCTPPRLCWLNP